jgi:bifunctional non-homologous end joining protein LigD
VVFSTSSRSKVGPIEERKRSLARLLRQELAAPCSSASTSRGDGALVFRHACKLGLQGIVSKRLGSRYVSGRSRDWLKFKNPDAPAAKREFEEDWRTR